MANLNNIFSDGTTRPKGTARPKSTVRTSTPSYTTKKSYSITIRDFGLQKGTTRTVYVSWNWNGTHTKGYRVLWKYTTGNASAFTGSDSVITERQSTYTAPSNAISVSVMIMPQSDTRKVSGKDTPYWTAPWSTAKYWYFKNNPPEAPSVPSVKIEDYKLTASLANIAADVTDIEWCVVKDDASIYYTSVTKVNLNAASMVCTINPGNEYKVRCRAIKDGKTSDWSEYSGNSGTIPSTVGEITNLQAFSETGVLLDWEGAQNCTGYEIQYTTRQSYFDSNPNEVKSQTIETTTCHAEITGLELGNTYFFRVRATNSQGKSGWSNIRSIVIGKDPTAPTTWSSTTTAMVGEELIFYWVHNATDGSSEKQAELELNIGGSVTTETIMNTDTGDNKNKTKSKKIDTSKWSEGTTIKWRVRTMGVTGSYGEWSVQRVVNIYAPVTLQLNILNASGSDISTITSFPFYIKGIGGPSSQNALGYHVSIIALDSYSSIDETGMGITIAKGNEIFSKYYDTSNELMLEMSPGNIHLENNIRYKVVCTVSMDSGLSAENSKDFVVRWSDSAYQINAEMGYDSYTFSMSIRPFCLDENGDLAKDVKMAIFRKDFDGKFTPIQTGLDNSNTTFVTDPHPTLDYGRYRITATSNKTGAVYYYDMPAYPILESGIIIQWDEEWQNYIPSEIDEADQLSEPTWTGSLVRLPYNTDISDSNDLDVSLVEYIGRRHPVSYYGTQIGQSSSWNADIPKTDIETIFALRRLSVYQGDVYVRESSGSGYWANVSVSVSKKHQNGVVPVTIKVTRVEGGI